MNYVSQVALVFPTGQKLMRLTMWRPPFGKHWYSGILMQEMKTDTAS